MDRSVRYFDRQAAKERRFAVVLQHQVSFGSLGKARIAAEFAVGDVLMQGRIIEAIAQYASPVQSVLNLAVAHTQGGLDELLGLDRRLQLRPQ